MRVTSKLLGVVVALGACAKASTSAPDPDGGGSQVDPDAAGCGELCDEDSDGVVDLGDMCPNTAPGAMVNMVGCAESQLTAELVEFPPFGLTWTPTGNLGRAGGLTWTYVGIQRADLFEIDWILCDDPATPCGLSLDGPIDVAAENWQVNTLQSDVLSGRLVLTNSMNVLLADNTMPQLNGRLTLTIVDANATPIPFATMAALGVTGRSGTYGAEIEGTAFTITAVAEIQNPSNAAWVPYLDFYDTASTPPAGNLATISFGGSFYAK